MGHGTRVRRFAAPRIEVVPEPGGPVVAPPPPGRAGVRPEIQALRAIAVLLVVGYHLWPAGLPGGFVGVDVFFAISGFLITSLLLRELERTGTVSLAGFWARRARRILPAALLVLLVCGVATLALVPETSWPRFLGEIRAGTLYVENWRLAADAVDYLHATDAPSPVRHYWSLSAEEQFYLVWPVLLLAAAAGARRVRAGRRGAVALAMALPTAASLAYSLHATAAAPAAAYFVTPARAWEFGAGGLLALAPGPAPGRARSRALLAWIGLAAIAIAAATYTARTPFPGSAALLPVLGAVAVMRAGAPAGRLAPTRLLRAPALQFLGDVSYGIYLWHWPLLVLAPFAVGALHTSTEIAILMLTILLAWLTKTLVEAPIRCGASLTRRRPAWTFALAAAATAAVLAVPAAGAIHVGAQIRRAERASQRILAAHPRCFGAAARDQRRPCDNPRLRLAVVPTPIEAQRLGNAPCTFGERAGQVHVCLFGVAPARAAATIALVGDSHASHWRAALDLVARAHRWRGLSITHSGCPFTRATADIPEPGRSSCAEWNRQLRRWFARHPEIHTVFVAEHSGGAVVVRDGRGNFATQVSGYAAAWRGLPPSVTQVIVLRDTPKMRGTTIGCVQRAIGRRQPAGLVCAVPRAVALERDPAVVAARRLHTARVQVVDLTPFMCSRRLCFPVVGGALVYHDVSHLTPVFARTLGPFALRRVDAIVDP